MGNPYISSLSLKLFDACLCFYDIDQCFDKALDLSRIECSSFYFFDAVHELNELELLILGERISFLVLQSLLDRGNQLKFQHFHN